MNPTRRVLVPLDDSEASMHAVERVGRVFAGRVDVTVELLHVAGPLPTALLEHGGASAPAAGLDPNAISTRFLDSIPEDDLAHLIHEEARRASCDTVVVGQQTYSWLGEVVHRHLGDRLRREAPELEVQVVP